MPKHFLWKLTCIDDNTTYELTNDPIGFDECVFKMQRHPVYRGIFNQFTTPIKFHNNGGGKQFIDLKYELYDINARISIDVYVDSDGRGIDYDLLFAGKLNLASFSTDGTYTTVNIDQSELATKLNTRADIKVPINVPVIEIDGQSTFKGTILGQYLAGDNSNIITGSYIFNDPTILKGKIFRVVTSVDGENISDSITFNEDGQQGAGDSSGTTTIQITDVIDGALTVTFANIQDAIYLYQVGQQMSLGQQVLTPVASKTISLNGIPLLYQSQSRMSGILREGSYSFVNSGISTGHTITVYGLDTIGNSINATMNYAGGIQNSALAYSNNSTLLLRINTTGTVVVDYKNITGPLDLWIDGNPIATFTPTGLDSEQDFEVNGISTTSNLTYAGFLNFNTDTVFDSFGDIIFGRFNDIGIHVGAKNLSDSNLPPILDRTEKQYIKYPYTLNYFIRLKGKFQEMLGDGAHRTLQVSFILYYGKSNTPGDYTPVGLFQSPLFDSGSADHIDWDFDYSQPAPASFQLGKDDKVWFGCNIIETFVANTTKTVIPYKFTFSESLLSFDISEEAPATTAVSVGIHEAFNQIADCIVDTDGNLYSEFYGRTDSEKRTYGSNGEGSARVISNGLCVRGHLDRYISASLNELFADMNAIDNIGMEVDSLNRLRIEKLEHFFDKNTKIATLPKVYTYDRVNENSFYYNQIEVGYDKWATEIYFKNGLDEIHSKRFYGTRVATAKGTVLQKYGSELTGTINNKLERTCKLVAGNYAIELTRRKNLEWSHDDFKYDNDNFIFCLSNKTKGCEFIRIGASETGIQIQGLYELTTGKGISIFGSASNDGRYTISSVVYVNGLTSIGLGNVISILGVDNNAFITAEESVFTETAATVLTEINGNIINNKFRPDLAFGWLNMSITPARMLQANFNHISAGLQKIKGDVQFLNGEGNYLASTKFRDNGTDTQVDYNYQTLGENASLYFADGNIRNVDPLWVPEVYRFDYPITYQQFKAIRSNPNGYIEFYKFEGQSKKGFILSMDYNLKTGITKFELLKVYDPIIALWEAEDARLVAGEDDSIVALETLIR